MYKRQAFNLIPNKFNKIVHSTAKKVNALKIKTKSLKETQDDLKRFGTNINSACSNMRKKMLKEIGKMPIGAAASRSRTGKSRKEKYLEKKEQFLKTASEEINLLQNQFKNEKPNSSSLLYSNKMRGLIPLDKNLAGKCLDVKGDLPIDTKYIADLNTRMAISGVEKFIVKDLDLSAKGIEATQSNSPEEVTEHMQEMLKYKPYLIGEYLKNLSPVNLKMEMAKYICQQTKEIYNSDEIWNIGSLGAGIVVGGLVGIATLGAGTAAAVIAGGAVTLSEGAILYLSLIHI